MSEDASSSDHEWRTPKLSGLKVEDRVYLLADAEDSSEPWQELVLLKRLKAKQWVVASPDGQVYGEDLATAAGLLQGGPRGGVPAALKERGADTYRFEKGDVKAHLARWLRKAEKIDAVTVDSDEPEGEGSESEAEDAPARAMKEKKPAAKAAADPGASSAAPSDASSWIYLEDRGTTKAGVAVDPRDSWLFSHDDRGVVRIPGGLVAVGRTGTWTPAVSTAAPAALTDLRTLPIVYEADGVTRRRTFESAVRESSTTAFADWGVEGPRTAVWLGKGFVSCGMLPIIRHHWWTTTMGLDVGDPGVDDHEFLSELLEAFLVYDQGNLGESMTMELIARRYQLWEEYYTEELKTSTIGPGFEDYVDERRLFLGNAKLRHASLVCPALKEWVGSKVEQDAKVLKERRKAREEKQLARAALSASPGVAPAGADASKGGEGDTPSSRRKRGRGRGDR